MPSGVPLEREQTRVSVERLFREMEQIIDRPVIDRDRLLDCTHQIATITRAVIAPLGDAEQWRPYRLTFTEARIASFLFAKIGQPVRTDTLMAALYFDRAVDDVPTETMTKVLACKIRKKLANSPYRIETVWAEGYRMVRAQ